MLVETLKHITTYPGDENYSLFAKLPELLGQDADKEINNEYLHSCHIIMKDDFPVGRFAIYINEKLKFESEKAICIGAYHCVDDDYIAAQLLTEAISICRNMGYENIVGPMNGSTWNHYRFASESSAKSFFLDIDNPSYYNEQFKNNGFKVIAEYSSNIDQNLDYDESRLHEIGKYYEAKGVRVRNINLQDLETELYEIASFANLAFANNFLFTPIKEEVFVNEFLKLKQIMNPKFIWIVEDNQKEIHSIFFAINDILDAEGKTLIIKTIAVRKNSPFKGIATYQSRKLNQIASELGYEKIIHALMINHNLSLNASKKFGEHLKSYSLYGLKMNSHEIK